MIRFNCDGCGREMKAKDSQAGKSIQCSRCFASVSVPSSTCPECGRPLRTTLLGQLLQCSCQEGQAAVPEWVTEENRRLATLIRAYHGVEGALVELDRTPELARLVRGLLREEDPEVFRDLMAD